MTKNQNLTVLIALSLLSSSPGCALFSSFQGNELQRMQEHSLLLRPQDIRLGMDQDDVKTVWGMPSDVEYAGRPSSGMERWIYPDSALGVGSHRIVYFEAGEVVGWETLNSFNKLR